VKEFNDIVSRLDTIHASDGRTDRHRSTASTALTVSVLRWKLRRMHRST